MKSRGPTEILRAIHGLWICCRRRTIIGEMTSEGASALFGLSEPRTQICKVRHKYSYGSPSRKPQHQVTVMRVKRQAKLLKPKGCSNRQGATDSISWRRTSPSPPTSRSRRPAAPENFIFGLFSMIYGPRGARSAKRTPNFATSKYVIVGRRWTHMKEQIIRTEHQSRQHIRERYGRPVRASVGRLRGRNGLHPLDSGVCHRLQEEKNSYPSAPARESCRPR